MTPRDFALRTLSPRVSKLGHEFNRRLLRGAVSVLQVIGLFPYRWAGPPHRPEFSVVLCLWSFSTWMFLTVDLYLICVYRLSPPDATDEDLDTTVAFIRKICEVIGVYMSCLFLLLRSRRLASVLEQAGVLFEGDLDLRLDANHRVSCVAFLVILVTWGSQHVLDAASIPLWPLCVVVMLSTVSSLLGILLEIVLFKTLCAGMSSVLLDIVNGLTGRSPTLANDVRKVFGLAENKIRKVRRLAH